MKRKLYTYVIYPLHGCEVKPGNRIGWRKTAKQASDFAAYLIEPKPRHPNYPQVIIVRRDRKPGDFSY